MKWYDIFASFYDIGLEKIYAESRQRATQFLDLDEAHSILDVACGTGANFKYIKAANPAIAIYGTDFSRRMLDKAKALVRRNHWSDCTLFWSDARALRVETIEKYLSKRMTFNRVVCSLGLSVIPDWEIVLDNLLGLLNKDGRIVIIDVFAEKRNLNSWIVEKIAKADLSREIWQALERKSNDFSMEYIPVNELVVGGKLFVATGTKR